MKNIEKIRYIISIQNDNLLLIGNIKDLNSNSNELLYKNDLEQLIEYIRVNKYCINNFNIGSKDLSFYYKNKKIVLKDYKKFQRDNRFYFIFKKINNDSKLVNKKIRIKSSVLAAIMATSLVAGVSAIQKNVDNKYKGDTNSYNYEDEEYSVKYSDGNYELVEKNDIYNNSNKESTTVALTYEDRSSSEKEMKTINDYGDIITEQANYYGIDPYIISSIATQERGTHSSTIDEGGAIGLMQIQVSVWNNKSIKIHNYYTNEDEVINITLDKLKNVDFNIKVGCAIFQQCLKEMNYNVVAAIQCYNYGYGNMMTILNSFANDTNLTVKDVLNNKDNVDWLNYRHLISVGDDKYVEHIFSYMENDHEINITKEDGTVESLNIKNTVKTR